MPVAAEKRRSVQPNHKCVDYPISFYIASSALNSGSLHMPRVIAASTIHYGAGHPLNRTEILYPESEGYMPDDSSTGPRLSIITRRSLLRGLLQALVSVKDIYRVGKAQTCLHICTSSRYLDLVWNEWLPEWETNGWPTKDSEAESRMAPDTATIRSTMSKSSRFGKGNGPSSRRLSTGNISIADSTMTAMTGDAHLIYDNDSSRLVNEDLLRKVSIYRRNFFINSKSNQRGAAYIQLINYRENPADKLAKEAVKAASLDLTTRLPRRDRASSNVSNGSTVFSNGDAGSDRRRSQSSLNVNQKGFKSNPTSPISRSTSLPSTVEAAPPLSMANPTPVAAKRPFSKPKMSSRDVINESSAETDYEDFNDAASTFSSEVPEPGTFAKVVALPVAAVAATVAAVMQPSKDQVVKEEPNSEELQTGEKTSFEEGTNEALAAVAVPPTEEGEVVPSTELERAQSRLSKRSSGRGVAATEGKSSMSNVQRGLSANSGKSDTRREPSVKSAKSGAQRYASTKTRPTAVDRSAPQEPVVPAPSRRLSFFSFGRKSKKVEEAPPAVKTVPFKPETDRLVDYRPPQGRHLRSTRPTQEFKDLSSNFNSPTEEEELSMANGGETISKTRKKTPIFALRTRASVREIFG